MCSYCFQWDGAAIVQMGWSVSEDLLCVADDGSVLVYDIHGAIKKTLTMGQVSDGILTYSLLHVIHKLPTICCSSFILSFPSCFILEDVVAVR